MATVYMRHVPLNIVPKATHSIEDMYTVSRKKGATDYFAVTFTNID